MTNRLEQIKIRWPSLAVLVAFYCASSALATSPKIARQTLSKRPYPPAISSLLNTDSEVKTKPSLGGHLNKAAALQKLAMLSQKASISEARLLLKELLSEYGDDADVRLAAADFYRSIGSSALSISQYQEAIKLDLRSAQAYMGLAQIYLANGNDSQACDCARQATLLCPHSSEAQRVYVSALFKTDRMREADRELSKLLAQPGKLTNANTAYVAYQVYRKRGQYSTAENYLNQALALDPKQNQWLVEKAELCELRQDYEGAREALEKALVADPYSITALYHLGLIRERYFQDYDGAINEFQKLLAIDPDFVDAVAQIDLSRTRKNDLAGQLKLELWRGFAALNSIFSARPSR
jgi:tetratricopeptide (TPR) repeat protein